MRIRSWRQFNDLATDPVVWSLEQQQRFIDQIFKLKFNSIYMCIWRQHPLEDYQIDGIRPSSWCWLFRQNIPIDDETIGREHFHPDMALLTHPDFIGIETFDDALSVGRKAIHSILDLAQQKQMHTCLAIQPLEYPTEFRCFLEQPTHDSLQMGNLTCAETADLYNPKHVRAIEARFRAFLEQWDRVDELEIHLPEHPHALSKRHALDLPYGPAGLVARTREACLTSGGADRGKRELKSCIGMLDFFDRFFAGNDLLQVLHDSDVALTLGLGNSTEHILPFVHRVLPPGSGIRTAVDYTVSRTVRRLGLLEQVDTSQIRATMTVTLQDDNVGHLPQVATEIIHILLAALQRGGWDGCYTRHWPIGDLDPTVAYLARMPWNPSVTPHDAYGNHLTHRYGANAVDPFRQVLRMLEDASIILDLNLDLLFPVHGIASFHLNRTEPMPDNEHHVLAIYESARTILQHVRTMPHSEAGSSHLDYWLSRLDFSIHALHEIRLLREAGIALHHEDGPHRQRAASLSKRHWPMPARACTPSPSMYAMTAIAAHLPRTTTSCCAKSPKPRERNWVSCEPKIILHGLVLPNVECWLFHAEAPNPWAGNISTA